MDTESSPPPESKPKRSDGVGKRLKIIGVVGLILLGLAGFWRWWSGGWPEDVKAKYSNFYNPPKGFDPQEAAKRVGSRSKNAAGKSKNTTEKTSAPKSESEEAAHKPKEADSKASAPEPKSKDGEAH